MPFKNARSHSSTKESTDHSFALKIAIALFVGVFGQAAFATPAGAPQPALRVTEISQTTHPFETLYCARQPAQYRFLGDALELVVNNESRILMPAMAASGARYVARATLQQSSGAKVHWPTLPGQTKHSLFALRPAPLFRPIKPLETSHSGAWPLMAGTPP